MDELRVKLAFLEAHSISNESYGWLLQVFQEMGNRNYFVGPGGLPPEHHRHMWVRFLEDHAFPLNQALLDTLKSVEDTFGDQERFWFGQLELYQTQFLEAHSLWKAGRNPEYQFVSPFGNFPQIINYWIRRELGWRAPHRGNHF